MFKFSKFGIQSGEKITSIFSDEIFGIVVDDSHISIEGTRMSVSKAAIKVLSSRGVNRSNVQGTLYWKYNGIRLSDMTERISHQSDLSTS
jgi:hypothetical protein